MKKGAIIVGTALLLQIAAAGVTCYGRGIDEEVADTLVGARVTAEKGLAVPQRVTKEEIETSAGVAEAIRKFAGLQVRDYGGAGGLKTINVRSLGSEHTGVFIGGMQVDNAQNMQVDLGRFSTENLTAISLYNGQKSDFLQSAKEYASASAVYLDYARPVFGEGQERNLRVSLTAGSFGTVSPSITWERLLRHGTTLRLSAGMVHSDGEYKFHVSDWRTQADGTLAGYDTVMTRLNCDLRSFRAEAQLFGGRDEDSGTWNVHAYYFDSERGLPGPVYKRANEYPLSEDRQSDRNSFIQGNWRRRAGEKWTLEAKAKAAADYLEYLDVPEIRDDIDAASFVYKNYSVYGSLSALAEMNRHWKMNLAADAQHSWLEANLRNFAYPRRAGIYLAASNIFTFGKFNAAATLLWEGIRDGFKSGEERSSAWRDALMPSLTLSWQAAKGLNINGFVKRSFRMPTFNDLYYTTVTASTLRPEDALQFDLGLRWTGNLGGIETEARIDAYYNLLEDKIIAVPTSNQFRWSMYNIGEVRILGTDVMAAASKDFSKGSCGISARYTFQRARDYSDPDRDTYKGQIPYIPLHSGSANVYASFLGWRLDITCFMSGERYTTSVNLPAYRLPPWQTLDLSLAKKFSFGSKKLKDVSDTVYGRQYSGSDWSSDSQYYGSKGQNGNRHGSSLTLRLTGNNLLNQQYEVVDNYPMPGTNVRLTVEYSF